MAPAAAQVSVAGIRDLAFGPVIIGIPSSVAPSDAVRSGQYRFTAPAGSRVRIDFDLPSQLNGPGSAKLTIKFGKTDAIIVGNAPGSVPTALWIRTRRRTSSTTWEPAPRPTSSSAAP